MTRNLGPRPADFRGAPNKFSASFEFREPQHMAARKKQVESDGVTLTPQQQTEQLDQAIEQLDKHAESELEMIRLFIDRGKTEIARRRLNELIETRGKSDAAKEARTLLQKL